MKREELRWVDQQVWDDWFTGEMYTKASEYLKDKGIEFCADIGAGVGVSTWWMLQKFPNCYVTCFEPNAENFILLFDRFYADLRIIPVPYGIYYGKDWSKVQQIGDSNPLGGMAEIAKEHSQYFSTSLRYYTDKLFYFTTLEESGGLFYDLIKIDTEGSEYNIIENSSTVQNCRYILLETHNHDRVYIENYLLTNLPRHRVILTQGHDIHLGFLLEKI